MEASVEENIRQLIDSVLQGNLQMAIDKADSLIRQRAKVEISAKNTAECAAHQLYALGTNSRQALTDIIDPGCKHNICRECIAEVIYDDIRNHGTDAEYFCPVCTSQGLEKPRPIFDRHEPFRFAKKFLDPIRFAEIEPTASIMPGKSRVTVDCGFKNQTIAGYICDGSGDVTGLGNCSCIICTKCCSAWLNAWLLGDKRAQIPKCPKAGCGKIMSYYDILYLQDKELNAKFGTTYSRFSMVCPECTEFVEGDLSETETIFTCPKGHNFTSQQINI